jgi:hypothetical protein
MVDKNCNTFFSTSFRTELAALIQQLAIYCAELEMNFQQMGDSESSSEESDPILDMKSLREALTHNQLQLLRSPFRGLNSSRRSTRTNNIRIFITLTVKRYEIVLEIQRQLCSSRLTASCFSGYFYESLSKIDMHTQTLDDEESIDEPKNKNPSVHSSPLPERITERKNHSKRPTAKGGSNFFLSRVANEIRKHVDELTDEVLDFILEVPFVFVSYI